VEYISHLEADFFLGPNPTALPAWINDNEVWASEDFENLDPSLYVHMHRRFLINNIVHILWVANKHPQIDIKKAVKQICIGTDFDGLINTIDCCKNADGLLQLKKDIREGLNNLLIKEGITGITTDVLLDDIFYNNGKNFMLGRLKAIKG
jgi:hypothetical protein